MRAAGMRGGRDVEYDIVPTEYERRSCAGTGPRLRAMRIARAREDPTVALGDKLAAAAQANDAEQVKSLLEQGAGPNHVHFEVNPHVPLRCTSSAEVAELLLSHPDVDANAADMNDMTVLEGILLHHRDNEALVRVVLAHGKLDVRKGTPLRTAARFASVGVLSMLLDHPGVDVNDPENSPLHYALSRTDEAAVDVARMLLQRPGVDINARTAGQGSAPLHFLSWMDSLTVGIGQSEKTVRENVAARQVEMLGLLLARPELDAGAEDAKGATALHKACEAGRADIVQPLLADGRFAGSVWHRDHQGRTPLETAVHEEELPRPRWDPLPCTAKHADVIKMLSEHQQARLREVPPPPLRKHPCAWNEAVQFLP